MNNADNNQNNNGQNNYMMNSAQQPINQATDQIEQSINQRMNGANVDNNIFNNAYENNNQNVDKLDNFNVMNNNDFSMNSKPQSLGDESKKKRHKKVWKILIPVILALLLVGGGYILLNNPRIMYNLTINNVYKKSSKIINNDKLITYDGKTDNLFLNLGFEFVPNSDNLKDVLVYENNSLNNVYTNLFLGINPIDKKIALSANYKENEASLINGNALLTTDKLYLYAKNFYDKTIVVEAKDISIDYSDTIEQLFAVLKEVNLKDSSSDIVKIIERFKTIYMNNISKYGEYNLTNDIVTINGSSYKLKKVSYVLSNDDYVKFTDSLLTDMKNDEELLNLVVSILNKKDVTVQGLKENLDYLIKSDKNGYSTVISFYYSGVLNGFAGVSIADNDTKLEYYNVDNKYSFYYTDGGFTDYKIEGTKKNESYSFNVYSKETLIYNIEYKKVGNDEFSITLTMKEDEHDNVIKIDSKLVASSEKELKLNISIDTFIYEGEEKYSFTLKFDIDVNVNKKLDTLDNQNIVNVNDLTDEETTDIYSKFINTLDRSIIYKMYSSNIPNDSSDYDYDYYYDYDF